MSVVIEEIVGRVEPENGPRREADTEDEKGERAPDMDTFRRMLRCLERRRARLMAD